MQSVGMPGPMLVQSKDYSFYAKWGRAESVNEISIPAAEGTLVTGKPVCNQYKMIWCRKHGAETRRKERICRRRKHRDKKWCKNRLKKNERNKVSGEGSAQKKVAKCWVKKHTSLHMMNLVNGGNWGRHCKTIPGASIGIHRGNAHQDFCSKIKASYFKPGTSFKNVNDVCKTSLVLL